MRSRWPIPLAVLSLCACGLAEDVDDPSSDPQRQSPEAGAGSQPGSRPGPPPRSYVEPGLQAYGASANIIPMDLDYQDEGIPDLRFDHKNTKVFFL